MEQTSSSQPSESKHPEQAIPTAPTAENGDLQQLETVIKLIGYYLSLGNKEQSLSEDIWIGAQGSEDMVSLLAQNSELLTKGERLVDDGRIDLKTLLQCTKYLFRHLGILASYPDLVEQFYQSIQGAERDEISKRPQGFQSSMRVLIDELVHQKEFARAYCVHELLFYIQQSLTTDTSESTETTEQTARKDVAPKLTATIAPMFQEAFGMMDRSDCITLFFEAMAYIVRDDRYRQPFYDIYKDFDVDPVDVKLATEPEPEIKPEAEINSESSLSIDMEVAPVEEDEQIQEQEQMVVTEHIECTSPQAQRPVSDKKLGIAQLPEYKKYEKFLTNIESKSIKGWVILKPFLISVWRFSKPFIKKAMLWALVMSERGFKKGLVKIKDLKKKSNI